MEPDLRSTRDYGSGMRVQLPVSLNIGPFTVECIYMFYFVVYFIGMSFNLPLVSLKHLLQCVNQEARLALIVYTYEKVFAL